MKNFTAYITWAEMLDDGIMRAEIVRAPLADEASPDEADVIARGHGRADVDVDGILRDLHTQVCRKLKRHDPNSYAPTVLTIRNAHTGELEARTGPALRRKGYGTFIPVERA